jgi:arylsulfatase A-like enzyme
VLAIPLRAASASAPNDRPNIIFAFSDEHRWQSMSFTETPKQKPNILLIISDDQGFGDFGFTGNKLVCTPNLDRLAGRSAVYRNFVVAAACSPTRSALFTGRDHLLTGVWGVGERAGLRDDETRMPAFFKAAGYRTMHVGKIDCVKAGKKNGHDFGWEDWLGGSGYEHRDPMMWKPRNSERGKGWTAEIWTDYALTYIRGHRDEPWFASVAYIIPHMPWVCDEKYSAPFVAKGCSENLAACYGSIAQMDECIGRLLDGLKETGQDDRTIVVFLSDNGPTSPEVKTKHQEELEKDPDWIKRNVAHLRGHKALVWENGDVVPLLVSWPGKIQPGDRRQFGGVEDILPTMLDLAEIKSDAVPHQPFTGVSLAPSLHDASFQAEHPALLRMAISGPGSPKPGIADAAQRKYEDHHLTLRGPRFKYHALPGGKIALYDTAADPGERADVQTRFPDVAQAMASKCRQRWQEVIQSGRSFTPEPPPNAKGKPKRDAEP